MAAAKTKKAAPAKEETPSLVGQSGGAINAWGPYAEYTYVTTPHGEYGLQAGLILTFEMVDKLNRNTFEMEKVARPERRKATVEELEQYGVDLSRYKPNMQMAKAQQRKNAPQAMEITINGGVEGETFPGVVKQAPVPEDH